MPWSENQRLAINTVDKNVLVAAGAGSGKTSVLVERIKNIIIDSSESGAKVDEVLVLTFTKAAASEMKMRLISTLKKMISDGKGDIKYLKSQLESINNSQISTFHSFAQSIIKENYFEIGLSPKLKVIDEIQGEILKSKAIDKVFDRWFQSSENSDFKVFLRSYSTAKGEKNIKNEILQLYSQVMSIPKPFEFLEKSLLDQKKIIEEIPEKDLENSSINLDKVRENSWYWNEIETLIEIAIKKCILQLIQYKKEMKDILEVSGCQKLSLKQDKDLEKLFYIKNSIEDGNIPFIEIKKLQFEQLRASKEEKENFEEIKEEIEIIKKNIKNSREELKITENIQSYEDIISEIKETYNSSRILVRLLEDFHMEYQFLKSEKKSIDFSDIEHMAIRILENDKIAEEYRKKYKYIFIDEYQDTNSVQEYIISKIKRDNNIFMVGDVKQSIYRFRMADPDIFESKYKDFSKLEETDYKNSIKIDLNANFRSKKEILWGVNKVFENAMKDYDDNAKLNSGITLDKEKLIFNGEVPIEKNQFLENGVEVYLPYKFDKDEENVEFAELDKALAYHGKSVTDNKFSWNRIKDIHIEAMTIADIINNNLGKKYFDSKENKVRTISYKDIVILCRSMTKSQEIKNILERNGIPVYLQNDKGYFDKLEIRTILDIIKTIGNKNQDIAFIGTLTSPAFSFTVEEIGEIRTIDKEVKFHSAFKKYSQDGEKDYLREKCQNVLFKLDSWKTQSRQVELEEFLWNLMIDTNIYHVAGTWTDGGQRQLNLRTFIDKATYYKSISEGDLKGFLRYIENIKDREIKVGESNNTSQADEVVKIMTIHKSKGLEFPIVILANTGSKFNLKNNTSNFIFNKKLGLLLKQVNLSEKEKRKTSIQMAVNDFEKEKKIEEEIRILYVAMTRAKEKLILVGTRKRDEDKRKKTIFSSFKDIILNSIFQEKEEAYRDDKSTIRFFENYDFYDYLKFIPEKAEKGSKEELWDEFLKEFSREPTENLYSEEIKQVMEYSYKFSKDTTTKSKVTVSELNKNEYISYIKEATENDVIEKERNQNIKSDRSLGYWYDENEMKLVTLEEIKNSNRSDIEDELEVDKRILSASERGNIYHKIMEEIDFKKAVKNPEKEVENAITHLLNRKIYNKNTIDKINKEEIFKFFYSDIGKRASYSLHEKELGFKMIYDLDGGETILQGVVDCIFEENGEIVIIDYKTNSNIKNIQEKYKKQLTLYKKAMEKAFKKTVKECWLFLFKTGEGQRVI